MESSGPLDVVYVDPSPDDARRTALASRPDFSLTSVREMHAALRELDSGGYDAVVTEFELPDGDAVSLVEAVRAEHPDLPVVVWTDGSEAKASDAIGAGVDDYLPKADGDSDGGVDRLVDRVRAAVERARDRRHLVDRERIGRVVRDINHALVRATTREELEGRVCEVLSEADPYVFAWIGSVDADTDAVEIRASAGVESGYLNSVTVTADETPTGRGPAGQAFRTGEIAVVQNVHEDPAFAPWREQALARGYRSVAAIPLTYGGRSYGLLAVYSDRPDAFDDDERELLEEVAADMGYAIDAMGMRARAQRYSELAEHAPVGIFRTEAVEGGRFVEANPAAAAFLGFDRPDELIGRESSTFYADADDREAILDRVRTGEIVTEEVRIRTVDDRAKWGLLTLLPRTESDGTLVFDGAVTDVTARKRLERELREEREFVERIFETSPVGITVLDAEGELLRANERAEDVLALTASEITDRTYDSPAWHIFDETGEPIPSTDLPFARVEATGEPVYGYEHGIERSDGTRAWLSINMAPMLDDDGELVRVVATIEDVTDRKAFERRLRRQKERLQTIVSNAPVILFALDEEGIITLSEGRGLEALGFEPGEIVGESASEKFGDNPSVCAAVERALDGESVHTELDFEDVVFDTWFQPIHDDELERVIGVAVDVSERMAYERELELFRLLIDQSNDSIFVADPESGAFTYVNDTMAAQLGYDDSELLDLTVPDVEVTIADADEWHDHVEAVRRAESMQFVGEHRRASGGSYPVEVSVGYVTVDDDGYYVAIARDVSELRERVQQLQVLGRVLRHNLRNEMNVVLGHAELLESSGSSDVRSHAKKIEKTASRLLSTSEKAYQLDEEFLKESRPQTSVDVSKIVDVECDRVRERDAEATIRTDVDAGLRADAASSVGLAIRELLDNALRHNDRERPHIAVTARRDGGSVVVEVADDGPGIPETELSVLSGERDLDQLHHASGLGLWLVHWIVNRSGGTLEFRDNDPRGSVATLRVPAADGGAGDS